MGRPRNISNIYNPPKSNTSFSEGQKSKGILDDFAVRGNVATKEGTIEKVPVNNSDIVNKLYADGLIAGATGSFTAGSGETITVADGMITFITSSAFFILLENDDFLLLEIGDKIING